MTTLLALEQTGEKWYNTGVNLNRISDRSAASTASGLGTVCKGDRTMTKRTTRSTQLQFSFESDPYFPPDLENYAPWVARYGLRAPYGKCQCGCEQDASIIAKSNYSAGRKMGHPARFVHGHNAKIWDPAPPGYKTCSACGNVKPSSEYYALRRGGLSPSCKSCGRDVSTRYHHENRDDRLKKIAEYQRRNKEQLAARERARRGDPAYREKRAHMLRGWRERNREYVITYNRSPQVKARMAVNNAVRRGELPHVSTMTCIRCEEAQAKEYHHYAGYEQENWYRVIPLCTECHGREHRADQ